MRHYANIGQGLMNSIRAVAERILTHGCAGACDYCTAQMVIVDQLQDSLVSLRARGLTSEGRHATSV